jgi:hypothetical protein
MKWARRTERHSHEPAHLVDGQATPCPRATSSPSEATRFVKADGTKSSRLPFRALGPELLSPAGLPFGRACAWCVRHLLVQEGARP